MSVQIWDIDGTLTTSGDNPNTAAVEYVRAAAEHGETIIVVSARPQARYAETERWLNDQGIPYTELHLNDFPGAGRGPNVTVAYKEYKFQDVIDRYGLDEIDFVVDNDATIRAAAEDLGLRALTVEQVLAEEQRDLVQVPNYVSRAAEAGLEAYAKGLGGDGLQPQTVEEAKQLAAGSVDSEKVARMAAWIRRHRVDWEGVPQNSDPSHEDFPGPGAVAALLWGVNPADTNSADRVLAWADSISADTQQEENAMAREHETRALPLGDFTVSDTEDGQKTFTGYAAVFGAESQGLPFIERIAKGAFSRALKQAEQGRRVIKFLHGHDEGRMLATTASGRLQLSEDEVGLRVEAKLDPADPDAAAVISKLQHEARAMGMSFGFTVPKGGQTWNEDGSRTLTEIGLLEVSTLSGHQPAYPATLGLTAIRKIAPSRIGVDGDALVETLEAVKAGQALDADQTALLDAVRAKLGAATPEPETPIASAPAGEHHSVAAARLKLEQMRG